MKLKEFILPLLFGPSYSEDIVSRKSLIRSLNLLISDCYHSIDAEIIRNDEPYFSSRYLETVSSEPEKK